MRTEFAKCVEVLDIYLMPLRRMESLKLAEVMHISHGLNNENTAVKKHFYWPFMTSHPWNHKYRAGSRYSPTYRGQSAQDEVTGTHTRQKAVATTGH